VRQVFVVVLFFPCLFVFWSAKNAFFRSVTFSIETIHPHPVFHCVSLWNSHQVRSELAGYGLCADEFTSNDHWPEQLYARETRRLVGDSVFVQNDVFDLGEGT
jgi:hypothetical protein